MSNEPRPPARIVGAIKEHIEYRIHVIRTEECMSGYARLQELVEELEASLLIQAYENSLRSVPIVKLVPKA